MWWFQQGFQWWMPFYGMGMMLFWVAVIGLGIWGVSKLVSSKTTSPDSGETPMEILRKRLARGEITTEQFEELQDSLRGGIRHA